MADYKVTLPWDFPYDQRTRAGVTVTKAYGYEGPLTAEQADEIEADGQFVVEQIEAEQITKPLTKAELLARAETDGLTLDVTKDNTRDEIVAAIEAATQD
ncbi:hypothetical protein [Rathayibacter festucae]|uniref:Uncharacterized protein n=1 Tax=Rathayibacter festucae DSM 15932 TaxID=1328866 RepID=A0A3Q9UYM3_9MICO|nr:hypothetical protein [Rathayibacter festucae]AZZ51422.1 hypothetical protein C1I64_04775 [Rathayibacter festucae DSM 15932]